MTAFYRLIANLKFNCKNKSINKIDALMPVLAIYYEIKIYKFKFIVL